MSKGRKLIKYGLLAAAALAVAFWLGQQSAAGGLPAPGSPADPLVSKSFVDGALAGRAQELEAKVEQLRARVSELTNQVAMLEQGAGAAPPAPTPPTPAPETGGTAPPATGGRVRVRSETANAREGPGTQFRRIMVLAPGTEAAWVEKQGGWYRLRLPDGREGWVLGELVEELR